MSQPQSRIPETMVADILGEAARLHGETHKGYTLTDLENICQEAHIPAHLVKQAHQNLEQLQIQRRSQRQQWRQRVGQLGLQGIRWGMVLILPTLAIAGVVGFRPQLTSLITAGVDRLQPQEEVRDDSSQVSTQLAGVKEQLTALQETLSKLKASPVEPEAPLPPVAPQPERPVMPPPLPQVDPVSPSLNRDSFHQQVMGKTEAEVAAAVGRPLRTSQYGSSVFWDYDQILDAWTGQEGEATVIFRDGKVNRVNFS